MTSKSKKWPSPDEMGVPMPSVGARLINERAATARQKLAECRGKKASYVRGDDVARIREAAVTLLFECRYHECAPPWHLILLLAELLRDPRQNHLPGITPAGLPDVALLCAEIEAQFPLDPDGHNPSAASLKELSRRLRAAVEDRLNIKPAGDYRRQIRRWRDDPAYWDAVFARRADAYWSPDHLDTPPDNA